MTWIRMECDFPDHELIGTLADKLRLDLDRAGMSLIRVWCRFGQYRPDGLTGEITDATLEDWAKWRGPRGRFAKVFREYCVADGKLRGWWRQEKLLAHQNEKRKRRKQPAENRQETGAGSSPESCPESADYVDGNVVLQSVGPMPRLINALGRDPDRFGVMALFDSLPEGENPDAWALVLLACLQIGLGEGKTASIRQLAVACSEFPAVAKDRWAPIHFKACVQRVMNGDNRKPPGGKSKADQTIATAKQWVEGAA